MIKPIDISYRCACDTCHAETHVSAAAAVQPATGLLTVTIIDSGAPVWIEVHVCSACVQLPLAKLLRRLPKHGVYNRDAPL